MAKKKLVLLVGGQLFDTCFSDDVISKNVNEQYEKWLGKDTVNVCVKRDDSEKEFFITISRSWEPEVKLHDNVNLPGSSESIFKGDLQLFLASGWQDNQCKIKVELSELVKACRILWYSEFSELVKDYKCKCKEIGATIPREMKLIEYNDKHIIIKQIYGKEK